MAGTKPNTRHIVPGIVVQLPAEGGGACGLVTHTAPESRGMIVFFFPPPLPTGASDGGVGTVQLGKRKPADAIEVVFCADQGIRLRRWTIVGTESGFDQSQWPIPLFRYDDALRGTVYAEALDPESLFPSQRWPVLPEDVPPRSSGMNGYLLAEDMVLEALRAKGLVRRRI